MKLLVTGGAGFIGSAVVRQAIHRGYDVINLDALTYASCEDSLGAAKESNRYSFENVDIRDRSALDDVLLRHKPDAIMHLAS